MEDEQLRLPGSYIELSEEDDKEYLTLTNLVCYLDYPNANHVQMDYGKTKEEKTATLERTKTLTLMPVYAKCARGLHGKPTFRGHEVHQDEKTGEITFDTVPIGVHEDVYIKNQKVTTADNKEVELPCVFAQQRIWKRNKNAVAAIKRLFNESKLFSSWEVSVKEYRYKDGIKHLEDFTYQGNTFLGWEYAKPAYGQNAQVISVASENETNCEFMIAEALAQDFLEQEENEVNNEVNEKKGVAPEQEGSELVDQKIDDVAEAKTEQEVNENGEAEKKDKAEVKDETPADGEAEAEDEEAGCGGGSGSTKKKKNEKAEAESTESDKAEVGADEADATTDVSALTDIDIRKKLEAAFRNVQGDDGGWSYIAFLFPADNAAWFHNYKMLDTQFVQVSYVVEGDEVILGDQVDVQIALPIRELNQALSEAQAQTEKLEKEVSELKEYKEKYEASQAAELEAKHKQEVASLRELAQKSGCFDEAEMASMNDMFEGVKVLEVKAAIADKKMAAEGMNTEISSETAKVELPKANLEADVNNKLNTFRSFLKR